MEERKLVTIMHACEIVDVSRRTIYNWIKSGKVEYVRTASGSIRIYRDTLLKSENYYGHVKGKRVDPTPDAL